MCDSRRKICSAANWLNNVFRWCSHRWTISSTNGYWLQHSQCNVGTHTIVPWRNPNTQRIPTQTENVAVPFGLRGRDLTALHSWLSRLLERRNINVPTELKGRTMQQNFLPQHPQTMHRVWIKKIQSTSH